MSPERWRQIEDTFQSAAELPEDSREQFLETICATDPELRREVESLLGYDRPPTHIDELIQGAAVQVTTDYSIKSVGQCIGSYEILEPIGRGGMGSVYLAARNDDAYRKHVAIKVVKRGMDSEFVLSRFRHERQILAGLEHPNIARLIDGGATDEGLPYFVMEYVAGKPITHYCRENKVSTRDRVLLFRQVCAAVQHAHQNLVVHRDLKPGNILVTAEGVPKLLDFGIAKMLHQDGLATAGLTQTMTGIRMLTPEYASPEQVRGEVVTTASDVYSLGVILFELLTGSRPYKFKDHSPAHVQQLVCDTQTERPSTVVGKLGETRLRRQLQGDIDNIVLMAMRKEPERRYQSVEQFSEDLRRHLEGLPVSARKDTVRYRMSKFVQRNRIAVVAAVLLLVTLVGGIAATAYQARVAARRFQQVRHLANAFLFEFHDSIVNLPGATKARALVVSKGLEYLDGLAGEVGGDPDLQRELATAYLRVGDVQGDPFRSNLGDTTGARASYQHAVDILEQLSRKDSSNDEVRRELVRGYTRLASVMQTLGETGKSLDTYGKAEGLAQQLQAANPSRVILRELASIHDMTARTLTVVGRISESMESTRKAIAINERLLQATPNDKDTLHNIATSHATLGIILARLEQMPEAVVEFRKSVDMREKMLAAEPRNVMTSRQLMLAYSHLGDALGSPTRPNLHDTDGALVILNKMLAIAEDLSAADPNDRRVRVDVMYCVLRVANVLSVKDPRAALSQFRRALQIGQEVSAIDPQNTTLSVNIAFVLERIGDLEQTAGNPVSALASWRQSVLVMDPQVRKDAQNQDRVMQWVESAGKYSLAQARAGIRGEALQYIDEMEKFAGQISLEKLDLRKVARLPLTQGRIGEVYQHLAGHASSRAARDQDLRTAQDWFRKSLASWEALKRESKVSSMHTAEPGLVEARLAEVNKQL